MPLISVLFGIILIAIGLEGFTNAIGVFKVENPYSLTALIPAAFGSILAVCGLLGVRPSLRKQMMHTTVFVGFVGAAAGLWMGGSKLPELWNGTAVRPSAIKLQLTMGIVCLAYVVLCIRSFINARKARKPS